MTDKHAEELCDRMEVIASLLAYQLAGKMTLAEGAPVLRRLGLSPKTIASVYESTTNAVNVRISEAKKKKAKKDK